MEPERDLRLSLPLRGAPWGPSWAPELVPGQALRLSTFGGEGGGGLGGVVPWVREGGWAEWRPQPGALPALTRGLGRTWPAAACPWRGRSWRAPGRSAQGLCPHRLLRVLMGPGLPVRLHHQRVCPRQVLRDPWRPWRASLMG